ncbi:hypothetical protein RMCBS344292_13886 [Rhizopus microsporus]|nr:hypothetical protein RMCBS344292_13886 [Rhizopus microsporus]
MGVFIFDHRRIYFPERVYNIKQLGKETPLKRYQTGTAQGTNTLYKIVDNTRIEAFTSAELFEQHSCHNEDNQELKPSKSNSITYL